jgi:hypothetical protein
MDGVKARLIAAVSLLALVCAVFAASGRLISVPYYSVKDEVLSPPAETSPPAAEPLSADIGFSAEGYFYTETLDLSLTSSGDITEIYYSLDGSPPTSESGTRYTGEPIELKPGTRGGVNCYAVKVAGKRADGSFTPVYTHSYFVGSGVYKRFDTLVFSLTTDPYNLYDYDYGVFVEGRLRDDYKKETRDYKPDPPAPANYNIRGRESERPVYVELLEADGGFILAQNAGMRVHGGWSRAMAQKSLRLFAREEYEPGKNTFDYGFFPDNLTYDGFTIDKYKSVVLRNNANDNPFAFVRDEVIQARAAGTGLQDIQSARPAAVFLNGEYYGFVWVKQVYNESNFDRKNGINNGDWAILSGGAKYKEKDEDGTNADALADFDAVYDYRNKDLTDDRVFKELCEKIDIDNFLTYYAVQIYVVNGDWPRGNYKVYKYFGEDAEQADKNSAADGKWRWLLFDTDFGMGLYDRSSGDRLLGVVLGKAKAGDNSPSPLFAAVMERGDMQERFVRLTCDLMNWHFSPEHVTDTVREIGALRENELAFNFKLGGFQLNRTWSSLERVSEEEDKIIRFAENRRKSMRNQLVNYFGFEDEGFEVFLPASETATLKINSCVLGEGARDFYGFYFNENTVELSAAPVLGYEFSHWLVNGRALYSRTLKLGSGDARGGVIKAELVTKPSASAYPLVKTVDYRGGDDMLVITNPFAASVNLKRYFLSDDGEKPRKRVLPDYVLEPGESVAFYCDNYGKTDAMGGFMLGFNLKDGETLRLSDQNGVIQEIFLPKIRKDYILTADMRTGAFYDAPRE